MTGAQRNHLKAKTIRTKRLVEERSDINLARRLTARRLRRAESIEHKSIVRAVAGYKLRTQCYQAALADEIVDGKMIEGVVMATLNFLPPHPDVLTGYAHSPAEREDYFEMERMLDAILE